MHRYLLASRGRELELRKIAAADLDQVAPPLLVSGFSRQMPDASFPLSPTLQLNADLAASPHESLSKIALAERNKLLANQLKSYTYTVAPRAAVIAADAQLLADFLDLYGGILEITPILYASTSRSEYISADELNLKPASSGGYLLRSLFRAPIDRQNCNWCRACISNCSEQCISSDLEIDFARCTLCGDCVDVCAGAAIDLYARAEQEFAVPAVILLGDAVDIELPAERQMIFRDNEIENFLAQIGEHQIEETVVYHRELCQYCRRLDLGCRQCLDACTHGALQRDTDGISIDYLMCQDCGACVAACPTGALQDQRFADLSFFSYFAQLEIVQPQVAVLGSESELRQLWWYNGGHSREPYFFLEYPQVRALTATHFLFLFALGFSRIVLLESGNRVAEQSSSTRERQLAADILCRLFAIPEFIVTTTGRDFNGLSLKAESNPLKQAYADSSFTSRREKMSSILRFLLTAAEAQVGEPLIETEYRTTYGQLRCAEERCTACAACLNECHIGALTSDPRNYTLNHEPALCVQCGTCAAVCPEEALSLEPGLVLSKAFFQSNLLSRTEPMICKQCGAHFGTKKSYQHVIECLRETGRFAEQEEVLSYCETCRAVKVFESYAN